MASKANTIKLQGKDYAQVAERIRLFRSENPNGKIITKRITSEEGNDTKEMTYRTYIWKDRENYIPNDLYSCDASAEASLVIKDKKDKEKLETISVGRALAILGYLASGEVASSEEMEDFYRERDEKAKQEAAEYKEKVIDDLRACGDLETLRSTFAKSRLINDADVIKVKDEMKEKLTPKVEKKAKKDVASTDSATKPRK